MIISVYVTIHHVTMLMRISSVNALIWSHSKGVGPIVLDQSFVVLFPDVAAETLKVLYSRLQMPSQR